MKLRALHLYDLRRFGGRGVRLSGMTDGLNVFAEPNETGKSTFFDALHALMFMKHSSSKAEVRSLKNYAGGAPRVGAEIETAQGRFLIEKQFLSRAEARVVDLGAGKTIARADEAETWIADLVGDRTVGPAGLLWVRQGESIKQDGGREARGAALSDVIADQVDDVTGGRRLRAMEERAADELAAMVTVTGRAKAAGPLDGAQKAVAELEAEEAVLTARLTDLKDAIDARARYRRDLDELTDQAAVEDAAARLVGARDTAQKAQSLAEKAPMLRDQAKNRADALKRAEAEFTAFETACADAQTAAQAFEIMKEEAARTREEMKAVEMAEHDAEEKEAAAQTALLDAQKVMSAAQRSAETRAAEKMLLTLKARFEKAQGAAATAGATRIASDAIRVDAKALATLEKLDHSVVAARARAVVTQTSLRIDYTTPDAPQLKLGDAVLEAGVETPLHARAELSIPHVGRLTISPGGGAEKVDAQDALRQARNALSEALIEFEARDLEEARSLGAKKADEEQKRRDAQAVLSAEAPDGLEALREEIALLSSKAEEAVTATVDLAEAQMRLDAANAAQAERRSIYDVARTRRSETAEHASSQRETLARLEEKASAASRKSGAEENWPEHRREHLLKIAEAAKGVEDAETALADLGDVEAALTLAQAEARRLEEAARNRNERVQRLKEDLARIGAQFDRAMDDGLQEKLNVAVEKRETAEAHLTRLELRTAALTRLKAHLDTARGEMQEVFFSPVNRELAPLMRRVLGGEGIAFDETSFEPSKLSRRGVEEEVARLSGGTQEQIAILTRLAFARLLSQQGQTAPVILDDALVYSDDQRIEDMFTVLHQACEDLQIIVFTCRQRAFAGLGGHVLKLEDWTPDD